MFLYPCNCQTVTKNTTCFKKGESVLKHPELDIEICKTDLFCTDGNVDWMLHHGQQVEPRGIVPLNWLANWVSEQEASAPLRLYWAVRSVGDITSRDLFHDFEVYLKNRLQDTLWRYKCNTVAIIHKLVRRYTSPRSTEWREKSFTMGVFLVFEPVGIYELAVD